MVYLQVNENISLLIALNRCMCIQSDPQLKVVDSLHHETPWHC